MKLIKILFISITIMLLSVGCLYAADNNTTYENNTPTNTQDLNVIENEILSKNINHTNDTNDLNATHNMTISETVNNSSNENTSANNIVENGTDIEYLDSIMSKYIKLEKYFALKGYPFNDFNVIYVSDNLNLTDFSDRLEIDYSDNSSMVVYSPNKRIIKCEDKEIIEYSDNIKLIEYSNHTGELILFNTTIDLGNCCLKILNITSDDLIYVDPSIKPHICPHPDYINSSVTVNNSSGNANNTYKTVTNTDLKKSTPIKTVVKAPKVTSKFKKSKFFQIKITDKKSKKSVTCKIKVKVYTGKKFKTYTLKTNKKGIAKFNVKTLKKGSHKVVIKQNNSKYIVNSQSKIVIR